MRILIKLGAIAISTEPSLHIRGHYVGVFHQGGFRIEFPWHSHEKRN
jgi:hypothetical protein